MMMIMPVVFTADVLWAPSGLVLYWFVEQHVGDRPAVLHELVDRPAGCRDRATPAERRLKNAGGGRSDAATGQPPGSERARSSERSVTDI